MQHFMDIEKALLPQQLKGNYIGKVKRLKTLQTAVYWKVIATSFMQVLYRMDLQWSVAAERIWVCFVWDIMSWAVQGYMSIAQLWWINMYCLCAMSLIFINSVISPTADINFFFFRQHVQHKFVEIWLKSSDTISPVEFSWICVVHDDKKEERIIWYQTESR